MLSNQQVEQKLSEYQSTILKLQTTILTQNAALNSLQSGLLDANNRITDLAQGGSIAGGQSGTIQNLKVLFRAAVTFASSVIFSALTVSRPLKLDSSGIVISSKIDLAAPTTDITGTLAVANGGTGDTTLTAHAVLLGEGVSGVAFATIGTSGRVLTDNGAGVDPTFSILPAAPVTSVNGKVGIVTLNPGDIGAAAAGVFAGATVVLAKITGGGANGSLTVNTAGQITAYTPPT